MRATEIVKEVYEDVVSGKVFETEEEAKESENVSVRNAGIRFYVENGEEVLLHYFFNEEFYGSGFNNISAIKFDSVDAITWFLEKFTNLFKFDRNYTPISLFYKVTPENLIYVQNPLTEDFDSYPDFVPAKEAIRWLDNLKKDAEEWIDRLT